MDHWGSSEDSDVLDPGMTDQSGSDSNATIELSDSDVEIVDVIPAPELTGQIERIIGHRTTFITLGRRHHGICKFRVLWRNSPELTWQDAGKLLSDVPEVVRRYKRNRLRFPDIYEHKRKMKTYGWVHMVMEKGWETKPRWPERLSIPIRSDSEDD